ncbi:MAG: hypothetical protein NTX50_04060 [Candidatus Sumerlaeota bacterium]|nr:hypothetical protein [Candidatus Sumerlaeota bacterium]
MRPQSALHGLTSDPARWKGMEPDPRAAAPATRALIRELDMAGAAMNAELAYMALRGATKGQQMVASKPINSFKNMRRQIDAILIESSSTAPYHRRYREILYSQHGADPSLDSGRLSQSLTFAEKAYPIYDVRAALDPDSNSSVYPYNLGTVYVGVAGDAPNAVRGAYSPAPSALFDDASVPRIYRFSPRHPYAKDFTDMLVEATAGPGGRSVGIPSLSGAAIPLRDGATSFTIRSMRLGVFSASRAASPEPDACTDAVIFYWGILDDEADVVGPDGQRLTSVFLGVDVIIQPAAVGPPAVAHPNQAPQGCITRADASGWRVGVCMPFEGIAKLFIGAKQTVCEAVRAPVSLVFSAPRYGFYHSLCSAGQSVPRIAATWETLFLTWPARWPHQSLCDILEETPLIGKILPSPPPCAVPAGSGSSRRVYLARASGGGGEKEQFTQTWQQVMATAYARPNALCSSGADVAAIPSRYGTFCDTLWSLLNLSDGAGYEIARDVLFPDPDSDIPAARPGDSIYLAAHGGGVQRATDAARILEHAGAPVEKIFGVAGTSLGEIPGITRESGRFTVLRPRIAAGGPRMSERAGEHATAALPKSLARLLNLPLRLTTGYNFLVPSSAHETPWNSDPCEADNMPGAFDPATGLFNWRPAAEDAQRVFTP